MGAGLFVRHYVDHANDLAQAVANIAGVEVHAIRNVIVFQTQTLVIEIVCIERDQRTNADSVLAEPVRDHERGAPRAVI